RSQVPGPIDYAPRRQLPGARPVPGNRAGAVKGILLPNDSTHTRQIGRGKRRSVSGAGATVRRRTLPGGTRRVRKQNRRDELRPHSLGPQAARIGAAAPHLQGPEPPAGGGVAEET